MDEKTKVLTTRINSEQYELFNKKAQEKHLTRSLYLKKIIMDDLNNEKTNENLLASSINTILEKLELEETKTEYFRQLFFAFLNNWFYAHPLIRGNDTNTLTNAAIERRNTFIKRFNEDIYEESTDLFEKLFSTYIEDKTDE